MRQNRNQRRLCSADRDPSLRFFDPQTSRKSLQNQVFQQPARFDLGQARSKLFLQMGLDRHISHLPAGQITCRRRKLVQYRRALAGARLPAVFVIPDGLNLPRTADTDLPAGLFARKGSLASEGPAPSAIDLHPQSAGINFIAAKTRSAVASKNRATAA
jgi:hypothetical protein